MAIELNKIDFERALIEMKEVIELLDHCVDDAIMGKLNAVIDEYDGHCIQTLV